MKKIIKILIVSAFFTNFSFSFQNEPSADQVSLLKAKLKAVKKKLENRSKTFNDKLKNVERSLKKSKNRTKQFEFLKKRKKDLEKNKKEEVKRLVKLRNKLRRQVDEAEHKLGIHKIEMLESKIVVIPSESESLELSTISEENTANQEEVESETQEDEDDEYYEQIEIEKINQAQQDSSPEEIKKLEYAQENEEDKKTEPENAETVIEENGQEEIIEEQGENDYENETINQAQALEQIEEKEFEENEQEEEIASLEQATNEEVEETIVTQEEIINPDLSQAKEKSLDINPTNTEELVTKEIVEENNENDSQTIIEESKPKFVMERPANLLSLTSEIATQKQNSNLSSPASLWMNNNLGKWQNQTFLDNKSYYFAKVRLYKGDNLVQSKSRYGQHVLEIIGPQAQEEFDSATTFLVWPRTSGGFKKEPLKVYLGYISGGQKPYPNTNSIIFSSDQKSKIWLYENNTQTEKIDLTDLEIELIN